MQTSFFRYMSIICMVFDVSNVGFRASSLFVKHIYKAIKSD